MRANYRILSFDCANKTLGVICLDYNRNWAIELNYILKALNTSKTFNASSDVSSAIDIIDNRFTILYADVVNLLGDKKVKDTSAQFRCATLKEYVTKIRREYNPDMVIIEDQMSPNEKTRGIFYCLLYEFSDIAVSVKPHKKNININFGAGSHKDFMMKYTTKYTANKKHLEENFKHYLRAVKRKDLLSIDKLHNVADAFFQVYVYVRDNPATFINTQN